MLGFSFIQSANGQGSDDGLRTGGWKLWKEKQFRGGAVIFLQKEANNTKPSEGKCDLSVVCCSVGPLFDTHHSKREGCQKDHMLAGFD